MVNMTCQNFPVALQIANDGIADDDQIGSETGWLMVSFIAMRITGKGLGLGSEVMSLFGHRLNVGYLCELNCVPSNPYA